MIPGGGVGDGAIDGTLNVHVIDGRTDEPIAGATIAIGDTEKTSDARGLVEFSDLEGPQTIAVAADGYRNAVWVDANGANVTIPLQPQTGAAESATLAGTISGWGSITVPQGHVGAAIVLYSHSNRLGDDANELMTSGGANICGLTGGEDCTWSVVTRTGSVTLLAIIVDRDLNGTPLDGADDINTIIGYAYRTGIQVEAGIDQSGLVLNLIEPGNLEAVAIDQGTPPPGLPEVATFPGIEISSDEVLQLPLLFVTQEQTPLIPKRTVFGDNATYRLTGIAQTASADQSAQSIIQRQGLTAMPLQAGEWLVPPVNVTATRTTASFAPVAGAIAHSVVWADATEDLLEITILNAEISEVEVPNLVALPGSGTLTARVQGIGADFDVNDFSLERDSALLWGISAQPVNIP